MTTLHDDVARIMAVMHTAFDPRFGEAWNHHQVLDALVLGNCRYRLVDFDGEECGDGADPAGFYLARKGYEEEELLLIAVDPQHRGKGIGAALLKDLIESARRQGTGRIFLEMRRGNPAATLYEKFGFATIGERLNYYRCADGTRLDAITFCLDLM